jgi:hypothetical protein
MSIQIRFLVDRGARIIPTKPFNGIEKLKEEKASCLLRVIDRKTARYFYLMRILVRSEYYWPAGKG